MFNKNFKFFDAMSNGKYDLAISILKKMKQSRRQKVFIEYYKGKKILIYNKIYEVFYDELLTVAIKINNDALI